MLSAIIIAGVLLFGWLATSHRPLAPTRVALPKARHARLVAFLRGSGLNAE
jgi:hypothetical protein